MMKVRFQAITLLIVVMLSSFAAQAQLTNPNELNGREDNEFINAITSAVPFLLISPDSRSGALGDAGVALSPDANLIHWNPAKLAYVEKDIDVSLSYSPWLRALVNDMSLAYLSGYKKLSKTQGVGASLRFFTLGNITFTDDQGTVQTNFTPNEFALDVAFGQQLSKRFSGGIAARYVYSNLTGGTSTTGTESRPGMSGAVDVSVFYTNPDLKLGGRDARLSWGINVSNIGAKMRYTNTDQRDFIPTNLKLGAAYTLNMDEYNALTLLVDFNKLLIPTPPIYEDGDRTEILSGKDPNVGAATGMIQSFYDAPGQWDAQTQSVVAGSIRREEFREINIGGGLEYWYADKFAVRGGYFYEHYTKGNRQFITMGAGISYEALTIDMSYLISTTQQSPLANTLRFSLKFALSKNSKAAETKD